MYKFLIRPILFLFDPEKIHHFIAFCLKISARIPFATLFIKKLYCVKKTAGEIELWGLKFKNPIGLAAGFDKNAEMYNELSNFGFGFIEIGTVTPKAQAGNPRPRLFRIKKDRAIINRMGFNNHGVDVVVSNLKKRKTNVIIGGNVGKNTSTENCNAVEDYAIVFEALYPLVDYLVVNVSCPNVKNLGALQDKESLQKIFSSLITIRSKMPKHKPVLVKISPDLSLIQIDDVIELVQKNKLDGIIATNTTSGRANLSVETSMIEKIGQGGLSGKPLKDASTAIIRYIHQKTNGQLPIIASGGVMNEADALEKLQAGASLVQLYTGFIYEGPAIVKRILKEIV